MNIMFDLHGVIDIFKKRCKELDSLRKELIK